MAISTSQPRSLLGNATWSLLATLWLLGVGFFLTPFLIARLGTDHYGLYILLMSIGGFLALLDLGLGEATLRYVAYYLGRGDLAGINRTVGATSFVYLLTGFLAWSGMSLAAPWVVGLLKIPAEELGLGIRLLRLTAISFGFMLATGAFGAVPRALQRYDIDTAVTLAQSFLLTVGSIILLLAGKGLTELVAWSVITTVLRQLANILVAKRLVPALRLAPWPSRAGLKEVFGFGLFSMATRALALAAKEADRLLLGTLVSAAAVAYLSVPKNLVTRGTGAITSAGDALFPRFSSMQDLEETRNLYLHATWSMLCATILIFVPLTILFPDFLRLWLGSEFARESAGIGQVVAASCIVRGALLPQHGLFQGLGKPQYVTVWYLGSTVLSVGLNVLLISLYGLAGAGYAFAITPLWGFVALIFGWFRVLGSPSLHPLLRAVALPILLALPTLAVGLLVRRAAPDPGWIGLAAWGALLLLSTAATVLGTEWLLARNASYTVYLARALARFALSLPWMKAALGHMGGRP